VIRIRIRMDVKYNLRNIKVCGEAPRVCASNECGSWWKLKCVCVQSSPPFKSRRPDWTSLRCGVELKRSSVRFESIIYNTASSGRGNGSVIASPTILAAPLKQVLLSLNSKGVRGTNKISCCFKRWASRCSHKYRVASKDRYRGALINIVLLQKMGIAVQS